MNTTSFLLPSVARCSLMIALITTATGTALAADPPPQRQVRPGLFARIGNAFQRLANDSQPEMKPVAQTKSQVQTRYNPVTKSYQILTTKVSVSTTTRWDGAVVAPTPGPAIVMRSSYSPGATLSKFAPVPETPVTPSSSFTDTLAATTGATIDTNPLVPVPATDENRPQPTATTAGTQGLTDALSSNLAPQSAFKPEPAKVFPSATFLSYGMVRSPYAPYNTLDVEGLTTGSLARDPSTGKIFRVP